jgi:hypothetical protein
LTPAPGSSRCGFFDSYADTPRRQRPNSGRRGAPPGNLNALKHGFYSRQFRKLETADLDTMLEEGLESEINLLRIVTRRVFDMAASIATLEEGYALLSVLSDASVRLASILRTQSILNGKPYEDNPWDQISRALVDINKELYEPR